MLNTARISTARKQQFAQDTANTLQTNKPRAKLVVLDANNDIVSKTALFKAAFARYSNLEYRPTSRLERVDLGAREVVAVDVGYGQLVWRLQSDDRVHVHDLQATVLHLLGLDHERLTYRHAGRDFRLTDVHGHVVTDIFA